MRPPPRKIPVAEHSPRLAARKKHLPPSYLRSDHFWSAGKLSEEDFARPSIAVIGTRRPSNYGLGLVRDLMVGLKSIGRPLNVLSGGALGVDAEAHACALEVGLPTQAWLVGPLQAPSPRTNYNLFRRMLATPGCGLLVPEELEMAPGSRALERSDWITRNRWLVAAADVVVVVEAAEKSGTWSTVEWANYVGLDIFAFPGALQNLQSTGTNRMISNSYAVAIPSIGFLVESLVAAPFWSFYNKL